MNSLLLAVLSAVCFATGGVFMKHSDGLTKLVPTLAVFASFIVGAAFNILLMKREDLGVTYVFVLGLEAVLAFALGVWLFKEPLLPPRIIGVALIVIGILFLKSGGAPPASEPAVGAATR